MCFSSYDFGRFSMLGARDRLPLSARSPTMMPRIQQLAKKKAREAHHNPGTKVLWPRNSKL